MYPFCLEQKTYTSGVWQFEAYGYVPSGTTGVSILQAFGASGRNTTLMLHVYGGRLMYYHDEARVVDGDIYDRWFRLNVVHDVAGVGKLAVFVDGERRLQALLQVRGVRAEGPLPLYGVAVERCQGVHQNCRLKLWPEISPKIILNLISL